MQKSRESKNNGTQQTRTLNRMKCVSEQVNAYIYKHNIDWKPLYIGVCNLFYIRTPRIRLINRKDWDRACVCVRERDCHCHRRVRYDPAHWIRWFVLYPYVCYICIYVYNTIFVYTLYIELGCIIMWSCRIN